MKASLWTSSVPSPSFHTMPMGQAFRRTEIRVTDGYFNGIAGAPMEVVTTGLMRSPRRSSSSVFVYSVNLDRITSHKEELALANSITATIISSAKACTIRNEKLGIITSSTSIDECLREFNEEVLFVWKEYGKEDDAKLTNDAKKLKREILHYVED